MSFKQILKFFVKLIVSKNKWEKWNGSVGIIENAKFKDDGMISVHNCDFIHDKRFQDAFNGSLQGLPRQEIFSTIRWRAHICCWAANQALHLEGDFVECGVWYGMLSKTIVEYTNFGSSGKDFYLMDAFGNLGRDDRPEYEPDIFPLVKQRFSQYPNVHLVQGLIPSTLPEVPSDKIAFLAIDMNGVEPDEAALKYFYPKMVAGGIIYFDDYGWSGHGELKKMIDRFFEDKPEEILYMPTGQGVVVKT